MDYPFYMYIKIMSLYPISPIKLRDVASVGVVPYIQKAVRTNIAVFIAVVYFAYVISLRGESAEHFLETVFAWFRTADDACSGHADD